MKDLARPRFTAAYHEIVPVRQGDLEGSSDVVGPVCESSDIFGTNRRLPKLESGDLVAILMPAPTVRACRRTTTHAPWRQKC